MHICMYTTGQLTSSDVGVLAAGDDAPVPSTTSCGRYS